MQAPDAILLARRWNPADNVWGVLYTAAYLSRRLRRDARLLFNRFDFLLFYAVVFAAYHAMGRWGTLRQQNALLLVASYYFYAFWDWRYLSLILMSTVIDFAVGMRLHAATGSARKRWLVLSVCANLGILALFKYFNFFMESAATALATLGVGANLPTLQILLPVGISFYTFQTLSYTIDIYRGRLEPTERFSDFALFVAFFPQLVAGPIEKAVNLLPQIQAPRTVSWQMLREGAHLALWGMFKKVFIADGIAEQVNEAFAGGTAPESAVDALIALYGFSLQIYGDFSGYTDIARGVALMLGFRLMLNFNLPYFAKNPSDLWRRWHISLSSWLREYLYFSLGGNRRGRLNTYRNLMLTMLLGGLWHGASWTFVAWGAWHGLLLVIWHYYEETRGKVHSWSTGGGILATVIMFHLTVIGWLFFRAESFPQILAFANTFASGWHVSGQTGFYLWQLFHFGWFLTAVQFIQWRSGKLLFILDHHWFIRWNFWLFCVLGIAQKFGGKSPQFIYFQF